MESSHWKISDFAKKLGKHTNTIDGWFRTLENERKLHYIMRINNEKIYDELDFRIAQFIIEKREDKWSLDGIFDSLPNHFSLRPLPADFEGKQKSVEVVDIDKVKATIMNEMKGAFEQVAASQMEQQMKDFQKLLPSREQQRLDRFNSVMAERKVTRILEEKALSMWSTKPKEERLVKVGWFRKEEDRDKRDLFVKTYIDEHFESAMKKEFGINEEVKM
ncbi:MerR family transcriptional regulator [Virgibacillus halodenitrificans]|nr:MerR family transcriptional regulator [Virgibacillus halodenitrificans]